MWRSWENVYCICASKVHKPSPDLRNNSYINWKRFLVIWRFLEMWKRLQKLSMHMDNLEAFYRNLFQTPRNLFQTPRNLSQTPSHLLQTSKMFSGHTACLLSSLLEIWRFLHFFVQTHKVLLWILKDLSVYNGKAFWRSGEGFKRCGEDLWTIGEGLGSELSIKIEGPGIFIDSQKPSSDFQKHLAHFQRNIHVLEKVSGPYVHTYNILKTS